MANTVTASEPDLATIEANPKWIRGLTGEETVVDSRNALFVWEHRYYPQWYFPVADVGAELRPTGEVRPTDNRGDGTIYDLVVGEPENEIVIPAAAVRYLDSPVPELRDRVRLHWSALEQWYEEEVEVFVHPRSPYTRVDVLPSTRRVTVSIDGTVVADSQRPSVLYETGLPPRYYLPQDDVRTELLTPTDTSTACPYKGLARYWTVTVDGTEHPDIVWGYDDPLPESAGVKGMLCFYNEKVDIAIDGEPQPQPSTKFS